MERLPHWTLTKGRPANYDSESLTAIEMVARLYGYIDGITTEFDQVINEITEKMTSLEKGFPIEEFKNEVNHLVKDYITSIDMRMTKQDQEIMNSITHIRHNMNETCSAIFKESVANGEIQFSLSPIYDPETESMTFSLVSGTEL